MTYMKPSQEVFVAGRDVQTPAHLLDLVEFELAVVLTICALPELLLPDRLAHRTVPQPAHKLLAQVVQPAHGSIPHDEVLAS